MVDWLSRSHAGSSDAGARPRAGGVEVGREGYSQFGPNLPLRALPHEELQTTLVAAREADMDLEIGMRGVRLEDIQLEATFAQRIGCRLIRTTAEAEGEPTPSTAELESRLRAALPVLEQTGTVLAIENARLPARELARAIAVVGSKHLGVTLDTVNSLALPEGTEEVVTALATHVRCLHLKDSALSAYGTAWVFTSAALPRAKASCRSPGYSRPCAQRAVKRTQFWSCGRRRRRRPMKPFGWKRLGRPGVCRHCGNG